jgi:hypothetical protein
MKESMGGTNVLRQGDPERMALCPPLMGAAQPMFMSDKDAAYRALRMVAI